MAVVGICSLGVSALPVMAVVGVAWSTPSMPALMVIAVAVSALWSLLVWRAGLWLGLRVVRGREFDLLADLGGRRALS